MNISFMLTGTGFLLLVILVILILISVGNNPPKKRSKVKDDLNQIKEQIDKS